MLFSPSTAWALGAPQGGEAGGSNPLIGLMPLILMFVIFYFLLIRPQQKKAKTHREMLSSLKKGDRIITSGGMYGRIQEVDGDVLTIDLGNDVLVEINRSFVSSLSERAPRESKAKK
jgi:preprotein translocase subunit YajC